MASTLNTKQVANVLNETFASNLSQIATEINTQLTPNFDGTASTDGGTTKTVIKEDLSNIATIGKIVSEMTDSELKDSMNTFIIGIAKTYFDNRPLGKRTLGLQRSVQEFAGVVQRVKMNLMSVEDTDVYNLKKNTEYKKGLTWLGNDFSNRVYTKESSYRILYQIPLLMYKRSFNDINGIMGLVGMIEGTAERTADNKEYLLELALLSALAVNSTSKEVKLITLYNELTGIDLSANREKALTDKDFMTFASETIAELTSYIQNPNKKYGDGSVDTFVPFEDIRVTMLSKFAKNFQFGVIANTFNSEALQLPTYNEVPCWMGTGASMLPKLADVGKIISDKFDGTEDSIEIDNVVGLIYDYDAVAYVMEDDTVTTDWNGDGAFMTYYHNKLGKRIVDPRNTAIVVTMN